MREPCDMYEERKRETELEADMKKAVSSMVVTAAERRRIMRDRQFAAGIEQLRHEAKQKELWLLYVVVKNQANSQNKRLKALRVMGKLGCLDWARKG